jgi:ketosteroid isomerase-like protein
MLRCGVATVEQKPRPLIARRGRRHRPVEDRLAIRFPRLATRFNAWLTSLTFRLPRRWRLRRQLIEYGTGRAFNAVGRGDLDVVRTVNHADVTWELSGWEWPEQSLYRGRDGVVGFTGQWRDQWSEMSFDVVSVEELEERRVFLAHVTVRAVGRASGVEAAQDLFKLVRMRDGLIWRAKVFRDHTEAIEAARAGEI